MINIYTNEKSKRFAIAYVAGLTGLLFGIWGTQKGQNIQDITVKDSETKNVTAVDYKVAKSQITFSSSKRLLPDSLKQSVNPK